MDRAGAVPDAGARAGAGELPRRHALGGLRHLLWDTGRGYDLKVVEWLARANLAGSIVLTLLLWIIGYGVVT